MNRQLPDDESTKRLMAAICVQAAQDYKCAIRSKHRCTARCKEIIEKRRSGERLTQAEHEYLQKFVQDISQEQDAILFFKSQWGQALSGHDGELVLNAMKENVLRKLEKKQKKGIA